MNKKNKNSKYIPMKNYIYTALIIIAILLLCWYMISWNNVKNAEKYGTSYLISTNTLTPEITNLDEIDSVLNETAIEYFVIISYTGDENVYKLEKNLKKIIDNYGIKDETYYINITDIKDEDNINTKLNNAFNTSKITNTPCVLYYVNNQVEKVIVKPNGLFDPKDFEELLKDNNYEKISQ